MGVNRTSTLLDEIEEISPHLRGGEPHKRNIPKENNKLSPLEESNSEASYTVLRLILPFCQKLLAFYSEIHDITLMYADIFKQGFE